MAARRQEVREEDRADFEEAFFSDRRARDAEEKKPR